jgi:hypothetical protein
LLPRDDPVAEIIGGALEAEAAGNARGPPFGALQRRRSDFLHGGSHREFRCALRRLSAVCLPLSGLDALQGLPDAERTCHREPLTAGRRTAPLTPAAAAVTSDRIG